MSKLWEEYLIQEDLIGHSPAIYQIRRSIPILAKGDQPVLITGEPGTEKLLIAKLVIDKKPLRNDRDWFLSALTMKEALQLLVTNKIRITD